VFESFGLSLDKYLSQLPHKTIPLKDFFFLASQLVEALKVVHKAGIIHNNIETSNVLINPSTKKIKLIDFDLSSNLSLEFSESSPLKDWSDKSLPYLSPEQTGRINRNVDYRSDFYALGVIFYEMLTGQTLFRAENDLEWVYSIISKEPVAPNQINKNIPENLAQIILKLVSKNAEERYQSSYGVLMDLKQVEKQLESNDPTFEIAKFDVSERFQIPQKLYGREKEINQLETYFENVSLGSVEFCLVSGYSGIGKTSLVKELGKSIVQKKGHLIQGKFDQFKQNTSYATLINALTQLIKIILNEPVETLKHWKMKILDALDGNGQLIVDYIPELEEVIGPQKSLHALPVEESQARFITNFINFINVFASKDHPLVIFLDDLQWSDLPTLQLIKQLVITDKLSYTLIIGAYRDNEVDVSHPLKITIRDIEKRRFVDNLILKPLDNAATKRLVAETLQNKGKLVDKVNEKIYSKTYGNPFFTIQLLKNLKDKGVIYFNYDNARWNCNLKQLNEEKYAENVIDILIKKQQEQNGATQKALQIASCIGTTFDLKTLSVIQKCTLAQSGQHLQDALLENMILPLDENYKYFEKVNAYSKAEISVRKMINPRYKFQHDRIQQAAYSQISKLDREQIHLSIGKLYLKHIPEMQSETRFLDMIDHLNTGRQLIKNEKFRTKVAELNLEAGTKAKESSAYKSALAYLKIGEELLGQNSWSKNYELSWEFNRELQHCYYLTGNIKKADEVLQVILQKSKTPIEKALLISSRTRQYITTQRIPESISSAFEGLSILNFKAKKAPTEDDIHIETQRLHKNLKGRKISELINLPEISENKAKIASQILAETFAAAFVSGNAKMLTYLVLKTVNLGLKYGNSPEIAFSYTVYGMLLCGRYTDLALGYQYGKLGVDLSYHLDNIALRTRIVYVYTMFIHHWSFHWSSMTPWFKKGIDAGYQTGDLLYLAFSAQDCIIWDPSLDLKTSTTEHKKLLEIVKNCDYKDSEDSGTLVLQMHLNFRGQTNGLFSLSDNVYDEAVCLNGMKQRHFITGICNYHLYKAEIHLLYNDPSGALPHLLKIEERIAAFTSLPQVARYHTVAFLVRKDLLSENSYRDRNELLSKMNANKATVAKWADHCPENFKHLHALMLAEMASLDANLTPALNLYNEAIHQAKQNRYRKDEAMANERAGRFLLKEKFAVAAEGYFRKSQYLFYQWGAYRKVEEMNSTYGYSIDELDPKELTENKAKADALKDSELDIKSILKASQAISGELNLEKLLHKTLQIIIENAGAQRGFVLMQKHDKIQLVKYLDNFKEVKQHISNITDENGSFLVPLTLINNAFRTQKNIVIDNASEIHAFSSDPYFKNNKTRSVSCFPLPKYGKWPLVIYVENHITYGAFTNERLNITNLLAGQAAISIENARIYEQQEKLLKAQKRFVPSQFLVHLGQDNITNVTLGDSISLDMNVLFLDILNFTSLVEKTSPQEVIKLLNELFNELGIVINRFEGFIDSYQGDQIMALFPTSSYNTVIAAIEMTKTLYNFNGTATNKALPYFNIGIGINSGPLVLGTMGSTNRMQCSVLGDTVNLASRIENLTRTYGAKVLIGENTYNTIQEDKHDGFRMVDYVRVKGKGKPVKIYEVINAEPKQQRLLKTQTLEIFNRATALYFSKDFEASKTLFRTALEINPSDKVFQIFLKRIEFYTQNPPDKDWKGYEILHQKQT